MASVSDNTPPPPPDDPSLQPSPDDDATTKATKERQKAINDSLEVNMIITAVNVTHDAAKSIHF